MLRSFQTRGSRPTILANALRSRNFESVVGRSKSAHYPPLLKVKWPARKPNVLSRAGQERGYGRGQGGEGKAGIEVPVPSLLIITAVSLFWWLTRHHEVQDGEVSFALFTEDLLKKGKVKRIDVINRTFARVILNEPVNVEFLTRRENGPRSTDSQAFLLEEWPIHNLSLNTIVDSLCKKNLVLSHGNSRAEGGTESSAMRSTVWFSISDLGKLESLLLKVLRPQSEMTAVNSRFQSVFASSQAETVCQRFCNWLGSTSADDTRDRIPLPPIFFKEEVDLISLARSYVPSIILTAATFITFLQQPGRSDVPSNYGGRDYGSHSHASSGVHDRIMRFGKATPLLGRDVPKIKFSDIAGLDQAKKEVGEFIEFLKSPKKFIDLGAEIPKGALLVGPPGTGKTLLAKAVAGEAAVPFYSTSGSDFIEMFVGVGPSRIRDLFDRARRNAPAIIFIDEIDTIGRSRAGPGVPGSGGSDERESTLNALLVELDGFTTKSGVIILAGTNRGDVLDSALTRPGRFDRSISLSKPSVRERKEIFDIHLKPVKLNVLHSREEISKRLAALTPGLSGAEIRSVCNEAAIIAARRNANSVTLIDLEAAVERLIGGLKHTGDVLTLEMKRQVALHEAGHAVVGWFMAHADPVLKLSIVPRASGSLGYTQVLPDEMLLSSREEYLTKICVLLGGRASEQLFAGSITTGAADDLNKATRLAHAFVTQLGFDSEMGLAAYPREGLRLSAQPAYSEATSQLIDRRIKKVLDEQWEKCLEVLTSREEAVRLVADRLVEKEVISFSDLLQILGPKPGKVKESVRKYVDALPQDEIGVEEELELV